MSNKCSFINMVSSALSKSQGDVYFVIHIPETYLLYFRGFYTGERRPEGDEIKGDADERTTLETEGESDPCLNPARSESSSVVEEQRGQDKKRGKRATKEWRG